MAVSNGRPQRLWSYQAGLGHEPVVVAAKGTFLVAVNAMDHLPENSKAYFNRCLPARKNRVGTQHRHQKPLYASREPPPGFATVHRNSLSLRAARCPSSVAS